MNLTDANSEVAGNQYIFFFQQVIPCLLWNLLSKYKIQCVKFFEEKSDKGNMAEAILTTLVALITKVPPHLWSIILEISRHPQTLLVLCLCCEARPLLVFGTPLGLSVEAFFLGVFQVAHCQAVAVEGVSCWQHYFKWKCSHPVDVAGWGKLFQKWRSKDTLRDQWYENGNSQCVEQEAMWRAGSFTSQMPLFSAASWLLTLPFISRSKLPPHSWKEPMYTCHWVLSWQLLTYTLWCLERNWNSQASEATLIGFRLIILDFFMLWLEEPEQPQSVEFWSSTIIWLMDVWTQRQVVSITIGPTF